MPGARFTSEASEPAGWTGWKLHSIEDQQLAVSRKDVHGFACQPRQPEMYNIVIRAITRLKERSAA
jgi:hypothetical protein